MSSFPFLMIKPPILNELADVLRRYHYEAMAESSPDVNAAAMKSAEVWGVKKINHSIGIQSG